MITLNGSLSEPRSINPTSCSSARRKPKKVAIHLAAEITRFVAMTGRGGTVRIRWTLNEDRGRFCGCGMIVPAAVRSRQTVAREIVMPSWVSISVILSVPASSPSPVNASRNTTIRSRTICGVRVRARAGASGLRRERRVTLDQPPVVQLVDERLGDAVVCGDLPIREPLHGDGWSSPLAWCIGRRVILRFRVTR